MLKNIMSVMNDETAIMILKWAPVHLDKYEFKSNRVDKCIHDMFSLRATLHRRPSSLS